MIILYCVFTGSPLLQPCFQVIPTLTREMTHNLREKLKRGSQLLTHPGSRLETGADVVVIIVESRRKRPNEIAKRRNASVAMAPAGRR